MYFFTRLQKAFTRPFVIACFFLASTAKTYSLPTELGLYDGIYTCKWQKVGDMYELVSLIHKRNKKNKTSDFDKIRYQYGKLLNSWISSGYGFVNMIPYLATKEDKVEWKRQALLWYGANPTYVTKELIKKHGDAFFFDLILAKNRYINRGEETSPICLAFPGLFEEVKQLGGTGAHLLGKIYQNYDYEIIKQKVADAEEQSDRIKQNTQLVREILTPQNATRIVFSFAITLAISAAFYHLFGYIRDIALDSFRFPDIISETTYPTSWQKYFGWIVRIFFRIEKKKITRKQELIVSTEVKEKIVNYIQATEKDIRYNMGLPKEKRWTKGKGAAGIILYGSPGVGKTMIANIIAKELSAFIAIVHGASISKAKPTEKVAALDILDQTARAYYAYSGKPTIIVIDEFDLMALNRFAENAKENDSLVVSKLLAIFPTVHAPHLITLATTNLDLSNSDDRKKIDRAILNRFINIWYVGYPDMKSWMKGFMHYLKKRAKEEKMEIDVTLYDYEGEAMYEEIRKKYKTLREVEAWTIEAIKELLRKKKRRIEMDDIKELWMQEKEHEVIEKAQRMKDRKKDEEQA